MNDTERKEMLDKWGEVFDLKAEVNKEVANRRIKAPQMNDYFINGLPVSRHAYIQYINDKEKK